MRVSRNRSRNGVHLVGAVVALELEGGVVDAELGPEGRPQLVADELGGVQRGLAAQHDVGRQRRGLGAERPQVEVVDRALVPGGPMGRNGKKRMFFALLVGLLIGGGGALVLDRLNTALYGREEIESLLHLPVLAIVPRVTFDGPKRGRKRRLRHCEFSSKFLEGGMLTSWAVRSQR